MSRTVYSLLMFVLMTLSLSIWAGPSTPQFNTTGFDRYKDTLLLASERSGVPAIELVVFTSIESNFKGNARNTSGSRAVGLTQITPRTCRHLLKSYGRQYGMHKTRSCKDPYVNALMTAEYIKENKPIIERHTRRPVTLDQAYMAHFIGPITAARVLKAKNSTPITHYVKAIKGNESLLFRKGKPLSVGQFKTLIKHKVDRHMTVYHDEVNYHVINQQQLDQRRQHQLALDTFINQFAARVKPLPTSTVALILQTVTQAPISLPRSGVLGHQYQNDRTHTTVHLNS